jgi:small subunit ribosomal protein S2
MAKLKEYKISLKDLLEAGCHFGHQARRWNPKMEPYIYLKREGVHIFDLGITAKKLKEAMEYVRDLSAQGKTIVFVGTKRQAAPIVKEEAEKCGTPYVSVRWLGGTMTNWEQIKKSLDRLKDLEKQKKAGEFKKYTKKENLLIDREVDKLERFFGGLRTLKNIPEAVFVVDVKKEIAVIKEARHKGVTVVGMVDTNTDPNLVDYMIPANDDAVSSIKLVVAKMAEAVADGKGLQGKVKSKVVKKGKKK